MFHPFDMLILDVLTIFSLHQSHANRYKRYIVPVLSVFMDFYVRVFVRVFTWVPFIPSLVCLFVQILYSVHHLVVPGNVSNSSLYMDFTAVLQVK